MTLPGFTAECAVYKTSQSYSTARPFNQATTVGIRPAQLIAMPPLMVALPGWRPPIIPDRDCVILKMYCDAGNARACVLYRDLCGGVSV